MRDLFTYHAYRHYLSSAMVIISFILFCIYKYFMLIPNLKTLLLFSSQLCRLPQQESYAFDGHIDKTFIVIIS